MSRDGKTRFAVLGLLADGPLTGYDIKQMTERSTRHFWAESYGNLYPTLKKLEAEKLVVARLEAQTGKPDRKVYAITAAGRAAMLQWLRRPVDPVPPRSELLLKLFFGHRTSWATTRGHLESFAEREKNRLETFSELWEWLEGRYANDSRLPFWLATLSYGRSETQAHIKWAEETLKTLRKGQEVDRR